MEQLMVRTLLTTSLANSVMLLKLTLVMQL
jgi:hypothetical protein